MSQPRGRRRETVEVVGRLGDVVGHQQQPPGGGAWSRKTIG
jgi:hypothetical protein